MGEAIKVIGKLGGKHPADGMTAHVEIGDGAALAIINPQSFGDGGPEWVMRYGNPLAIRYSVASLLESYDHLLSDEISTGESIRRLRIMRRARTQLALNMGG